MSIANVSLRCCIFLAFLGVARAQSVGTAFEKDGFAGRPFEISSTGIYALDPQCGPALGLPPANVLGFRPRSIKVQPGYRV